MTVGVLSIRLLIPGSHSLKDKRRALRSIKDRLRTGFNVSVAEVDCQDVWQTAVLAVAAVGADRGVVDGLLGKVSDLVRRNRQVEVVKCEKEFL
jgi:hypothetical protein